MDSKFEFWNDLPNEMLMEFVKKMDFKSRMQLRSTSKHGKELVEATPKYQFDSLDVTLDEYNGSQIIGQKFGRNVLEIVFEEHFKKAQKLIFQLSKFSTTEILYFSSNFTTDEAVSKFLGNFTNPMAFHFKKIALCCHKQEIVKFFLENCKSAEMVQIVRPTYGFYDDEFMNILQLPVIINAKEIELMNLEAPENLYQLINNWLEKDDLEMGTTINTSYCTTELIGFLAGKFENRSECIKRMDFKTRMRLRATSKQNKSLVESTPKYRFDNVRVCLDLRYRLEVVNKESEHSKVENRLYCKENATREFFDEAQHLVIQILKFSTIKNINFHLYFETDEAVSSFLANFPDSMTFRLKKIRLWCSDLKVVQFLLKNCESAETVFVRPVLGLYGPEFVNILRLPVIINAKTVELMYFDAPEALYQLIRNWLEKDDLELRKTLKMCCCHKELIDFLTEKVGNRVVSKTDKTLRIRTNDATKHIFINWGLRWRMISALVIPSDQKDPVLLNDD